MSLHLNLSQIGLSIDSDRPGTKHFITNRVTLRKGLDVGAVESCLNSLDVFRDLLEGIPHQKNRVVRDVCKKIQLKHYNLDDVIYNIGQKSQSVYFCLSGSVSICLVKQVPKKPGNHQAQQNLRQKNAESTVQSARNNNKLNTPKMIQSLISLSSIGVTSTLSQLETQFQQIEQQIMNVQSGQGFGQAEFIAGTKRQLKAISKSNNTLIGILQVQHFAEVLQNYRARVYYKKRDMFQKCALFAGLPMNKLQFIINNTKPLTVAISNKIAKEGAPVDTIFLVNKGEISLWKTGIQLNTQASIDEEQQQNDEDAYQSLKNSKSVMITRKKLSQKSMESHASKQENKSASNIKFSNQVSSNKVYSSLLKLKSLKNPIPQQKHSKVFMGLLSQGCFLGDMQLVMGHNFKFNAVCRTETAQVYCCDKRIILSQMTEENLQSARNYYSQKQSYISQRIDKYKLAKRKIIAQKQIDLLPPLTKAQIQLKRKLMRRHVEDKPSLIGSCSPGEIRKMILRKQQRVIKQPQMSRYPILQLFPNHSAKKRSLSPSMPSSFSPLSLIQSQGKRCITQFEEIGSKKSAELNPQLTKSKDEDLKSILIKIKPTKINISDIKYDQQKNMAIVGKILGRYKKCQSKIKNLSQVIDKMERGRR